MSILAASTLGLGTHTPDGRPWGEADAGAWRRALGPFVAAGYDAVELATSWLDPVALPDSRRTELVELLEELGLTPVGVLATRWSVIEPGRGAAHLAATHRLIDTAADLGIGFVCTGLHGPLPPDAAAATWFWSVPGTPADPADWATAVARIRELADHAADRGIRLTLELYERTFLGDAVTAARFLDDVGHPACGVNADLGNLQRAPEPVAPWEEMLRPLLRHLDYWHVKNCQRAEEPARGIHLSWPTEHAAGVIDYRRAIALARQSGFDGPVVAEHYGGDAVGVIARARPYLAALLEEES